MCFTCLQSYTLERGLVSNQIYTTECQQDTLERLYPQAQYHRFPRGAHRDSVTAPEAEIAVIRDFLRRGSVVGPYIVFRPES